jgi:hypothetical protein
VYRRSLELLVTRQMTAAKSGDKDHGSRGVSVSQSQLYMDLMSVPLTTGLRHLRQVRLSYRDVGRDSQRGGVGSGDIT